MADTPQHIKEKQLAIWLNKTPSERLKQTLADNEALFLFWLGLFRVGLVCLGITFLVQSRFEHFVQQMLHVSLRFL